MTIFLEINQTFFKFQFGFRYKPSTSHALISQIEQIRKAPVTYKLACGIFTDLRNAFDTVNHEILLLLLFLHLNSVKNVKYT